MTEDKAKLTPHAFKNAIYLRRVGNRDLVHIEVGFKPHKLFGRKRRTFILMMLPCDFARLAVLFPHHRIVRSNGYPAIAIKLPFGEPHKVYVATVLDYLDQQEEYRAGKLVHRPTTKGVYTGYGTGGPWLLTPENRERRDGKADGQSTSWKTRWAIDHRQRQLALGKDPDAPAEFSERSIEGFLVRSGKGGLLWEGFARQASGLNNQAPPSSDASLSKPAPAPGGERQEANLPPEARERVAIGFGRGGRG